MFLTFVLQFIISIILGFAFWNFFAGKYEGDKLERSFRPKVGKYRVHIHHWIYCCIILVIFILVRVYNPILLGLLIGLIIQGLSYKDRFVVIYRDADFKKIYSKFRE